MGEDDGERLSRREILGLAGTALGAGLVGGYVYRDKIAADTLNAAETAYRRAKQITDTDLDGLPDQLENDPSFRSYLENTFETSVEPFDADQQDLIVDARYVGDQTFSEKHKDYLKDLFKDRIDVNLRWLDYPETYDEDEFMEEYGYDPTNMLWGPDSFYEQEVEDELKNTAMQILFVPGKAGGKHEGGLYCAPGESYASGFSALNRAVIGDMSPHDKLIVTLHEMLHLGNWKHDYGNPNDKGVMGQRNIADATPAQWERMKKRLHFIDLSAPSFVYDYGVQLTQCNDMDVPDG